MNLSYLLGVTGCNCVFAVSGAPPTAALGEDRSRLTAHRVQTARYSSVSRSQDVIAAPIVGVDDETAARDWLHMILRFRQLRRVGRLDLWQRNRHCILVLYCLINRAADQA
jgi:hypothetical protein